MKRTSDDLGNSNQEKLLSPSMNFFTLRLRMLGWLCAFYNLAWFSRENIYSPWAFLSRTWTKVVSQVAAWFIFQSPSCVQSLTMSEVRDYDYDFIHATQRRVHFVVHTVSTFFLFPRQESNALCTSIRLLTRIASRQERRDGRRRWSKRRQKQKQSFCTSYVIWLFSVSVASLPSSSSASVFGWQKSNAMIWWETRTLTALPFGRSDLTWVTCNY